MADILERRTNAHARLADDPAGADAVQGDVLMGLPKDMAHAPRVVWVERISLSAAQGCPAIDEEQCAFGLRFIGSASAPVLDDT